MAFSLGDIFSGISSAVNGFFNIGGRIVDSIFNPTTFLDDGSVDFKQNPLDVWFNGRDDESARYANEYNNSLKQYAQQYQLQKDSFDFNKNMSEKSFDFNKQLAEDTFALNKQNMLFNQNLANRQQALSEESYRNGVVNQANQLQSLGINPASMGGSISGLSMSGGSNVSGIGSSSIGNFGAGNVGSPTGSGVHSSIMNKQALKLQMLSYLLDLKKSQSEIDVNKSVANVNNTNASVSENRLELDKFTAGIDAIKSISGIKVDDASIRHMDALTSMTVAETSDLVMKSEDYKNFIDTLKKFGLSASMLTSLQNIDYKTALALGLVQFVSDGIDFGLGVPSSGEAPTVVDKIEAVSKNNLTGNKVDVLSNGIDMFLKDYPKGSPIVSEITTSDINYWKTNNWSSEQISTALFNMAFKSGYLSKTDKKSYRSVVDNGFSGSANRGSSKPSLMSKF